MDFTLDKKLLGFRQIAQEKLQGILCSIPDNQKDLVIEMCLIKPLEHICGASWLRFVSNSFELFSSYFIEDENNRRFLFFAVPKE